MFEKVFGSENHEIKESDAEEAKKIELASETDHETGAVRTKKEEDEERKKNWEDPTRYRDLR